MKILFILPWVPYPLHSGGNQAFFNMVNILRKEHKISIVPYCYNPNDKLAAEELQGVWPDVDIEPFYYTSKETDDQEFQKIISSSNKYKYRFFSWIEASMKRKKKRIIKRNNLAIHFSKGKGLNTEKYQGLSLGGFVKENSTLFMDYQGLTKEYLEFIYNKSRQGFDMIQVEFFECLQLVYILPDDVRKVFVHHELRFIRNENEAELFDSFSMHDEFKLEKQKDEEISALSRYNDIIVLTDIDKNILKSYLPNSNIYVSPALTSTSALSVSTTFKESHDLVFIGGSEHFPNVDGLLWFATEVMPILINKGFHDHVYIVGKWRDDIKEIINQKAPTLEFTGFIEDLHGFINGKITIVPIRIGSGMRMKIIDAMAAKSPMVTTSKGCEGLPFQHGSDCYIADDPVSFAQCIIDTQKSVGIQEQMLINASKKMTEMLDAEKLLSKRLEFYHR